MKTLLVQPPNYAGSPLDNMLTGWVARAPQLGLLYLAGSCRGRHDVSVLDLNLEGESVDTAEGLFALVEDRVDALEPDVVGFNTMANVYPWVIRCCERVRARAPEAFIVLGGEQASLTAAESLQAFPWLDAVVRGEGEETFAELLNHLERRLGLAGIADVAGIAYRDGGVVETPRRPPIADLDLLPLPAYDKVLPLDQYQPGQPILRANMITSRGCPYDCTFCSVQTFWERRIRYSSVARIIEEIRFLRDELGVGFIDFADDTFTIHRNHTLKLCEAVVKADLDVEWFCRSRVDRVDDQVLGALREAGCSHLFYGAESGSPKILGLYSKDIERDEILEAVQQTAAAGIKTILSFIYGHPDESPKEMEETVAFARDCLEEGAHWVSFQRLTALPATPVARRITGDIDLGGGQVGGSRALTEASFFDEVRPMIAANPQIFSAYHVLENPHFDSERSLRETFWSLVEDYKIFTMRFAA